MQAPATPFLPHNFQPKKSKMFVEWIYHNVGDFKYRCGMLIHIDAKGALEGSEWHALIAADVCACVFVCVYIHSTHSGLYNLSVYSLD